MNIPESEQVKLRYIGRSAGYRTFFGLATKTGYRFGRAHPENTVHRDDVEGLLQMYLGGDPQFQLVADTAEVDPGKAETSEAAPDKAETSEADPGKAETSKADPDKPETAEVDPDKPEPAKKRGRPKKDA